MTFARASRARRPRDRRTLCSLRSALALLTVVAALFLAACQASPGVGTTTGLASTTSELPTAASTKLPRPLNATVRDGGAGGVTVEATWLGVQEGGMLAFKLALDTHSVDLATFDVAENVALRDGAGRELAPAGWQDESRDSHHRSGIVRFPASSEHEAGRVMLVVRNLAGAAERGLTFEYQR